MMSTNTLAWKEDYYSDGRPFWTAHYEGGHATITEMPEGDYVVEAWVCIPGKSSRSISDHVATLDRAKTLCEELSRA